MQKTLATLLTIALVSASPAFAKASKKESIGVGTGAAIGAVAGGPVGFIIGAAIGAKLGNTLHEKSQTIDGLNVSLDSSRRDVVALEHDVQALNADVDTLSEEINRFRQFDRPKLINLMQAGIAMDLLFRTDEYVLADSTGARLAHLAQDLASMPDIRVQLDGFADERGDADYNLQLSQKRVEFVREQLVTAGMSPARIQVNAHGEVPAQDESADSYALERRVTLKLFIDEPQPFAAGSN